MLFENRVLMKVFEPKILRVTEKLRKLLSKKQALQQTAKVRKARYQGQKLLTVLKKEAIWQKTR